MATQDQIYLGFWTNWSFGQIQGATLTLTHRDGAFLVAFLALFVRITGGHAWQLLCWIIFQFRAEAQTFVSSSTSQSAQQLAILRNSSSATSAIHDVYLADRKWTKRDGYRACRSSTLIFLALLNVLGFGAAAVFSSKVTSSSSDVLRKPGRCGIWPTVTLNDLNETEAGLRLQDEYQTQQLAEVENFRAALSLSQACFDVQQQSNSSAPCTSPGLQAIPWTFNSSDECPFGQELCTSNSVTFDSGMIDTQLHLGINSRTHDRLHYRANMTCAPLDLSSYEKRYTAKNISTLWPDYTITPGNHSDHPLDRILARSNTSTFTAYFLGESLHRRDDGMLATYYVTSGGRRALTSGSPHLEVPYMLQAHTREIDGNGTFDAIPDLTSAASDTLLVFLHNRVFFTRPVRDPLFKATRATDFPTDSVLLEGSTANVTAYVANEDSDRTVSSTAVACFSDTTYCNPALPDQPCVHSLRKKGIRSLLLTPTQQQILDRIHAPKVASMARLIKTLGAQSMLASRSIRRRNSPGLPDDQWILELGNWFSTLLFREQLLARRFATGYRNQQYNEFIVAPEPESEWMCRAQMTRSSDHSSFSVLGLAIILILGSLIIIANLTLASIVDWIRARQKNNPGGRFRTQQWKEMELLALHEKAYGHEAGIVMDTGSFTAPSGKRLTLTTVGRSSSEEYVGGRPTHSHTYGRISNATVILYPTNCGSFTEAFYNGLNEISYVLPVGNRLIPGYIGYLLAEPEARFIHTIILIHGFPDLSAGWRYQIPFFVEHGFRVIVPDCIGYGRSDAPTDSLQPYTFKSQVDDFYELCKSLGCESVIVAGHDWGSIMATHFTLWYPSFVTHLVTVAVPFFPPSKDYVPLDVLIKHMPLLGYQLQWGSAEGVVENFTKDEDGMRTFLRAAYGGLTPEGEYPFTPKNGYDLNRLPSVGDPALLDVKELDYYVQEFSRNGMRGPCNYYRTTQANFEATRPLLDRVDGGRLKVPYLFVRAMDDILVTDEWVAFMVQHVDQPVVKEVDAGHWALWEKPKEVNEVLREWLESQNFLSSGK